MGGIEEVLSKIDIVEFISSYIPLKRAGRNFKALCPFHSEKTPSFIVSPELQIYKCFGCGEGGNAIKFLSEYEKISFGEALRVLAQRVGVKLDRAAYDKKQALRDRLYQINHLASEFYHYILTKHKAGGRALAYLKKRRINKATIEKFKLGFAPVGWENLFNFLVGKKGYNSEEVEKAGLIIASFQQPVSSSQFPADNKNQRKTGNWQLATGSRHQKYYDRFRERIIFPIFNLQGNIVGFSGRVLQERKDLPADRQGAKYINTPETFIYHKSASLYGLRQARQAIRKKDRAILVEGEFDVLSSCQAKVENIVAIKGTALTKEQVELLSRFTKNFVFCLDTDLAGKEACKRGIEVAERQGVNIRVIVLTQGKDVDQFARDNPSGWRKQSKKTIPVFDFYLNLAVERFGTKEAESKKRITEEILPIFSRISNQVVKAHYFKKLAEVLAVDERVIAKEAERLAKKEKVYPSQTYQETDEKKEVCRSRREVLEEYLLAILLQSKESFSFLIRKLKADYLKTPAVKRIFAFLKKYRRASSVFKIGKFVKMIPDELGEITNRLFLFDLKGLDGEEEKLKREWQKSWQEVEKMALRDKLGELRGVLGDKERSKKEKEKAEKEVVEIVKKLKG